MSKKAVAPAGAPKAIGPYSQAIRSGDFLFCSGQIPVDPMTGELVSPKIERQTEQVLANIKSILSHEDLSPDDVVKSTVFLADLRDFSAMNAIYGQFFREPFPARSTIQVAGLPRGAKIEIEIVARYPGRAS